MAKTPIKDWDPIGIPCGRTYSRKGFGLILEEVGLELSWLSKLHLRRRIEATAKWYRVYHDWGGKPPPSVVAKQLASIANLANRLLTALGVPHGTEDACEPPPVLRDPLLRAARADAERRGGFKDIEPVFERTLPNGKTFKDFVPESKLEQVVAGIGFLACWAIEAKNVVRDEVAINIDSGDVGHHGNVALDGAMKQLGWAYKEAYGREPGISKMTRSGGPWIRFLQACLRPLGVDDQSLTVEAIERRWRALNKS